MAKIAFLGTGTMGFPMARNLSSAGFSVSAWNRSVERARPLAEHGAEVFEDAREAAGDCEVLVTMLSDADAVIETAQQALDGLADDALWLQMSTIGTPGIERCAELADRAAVQLVDAPVLGTREPAERGELVILASGPDDVSVACDPIFDALGSRTLWLGEAGAGTKCKVVVNSWIVGVVAVLAETITLAESLGVDPQRFFDAVEGGALDLPYARLKGKEMIEKSFDSPAFRLALSRKDTDLVLAAARQAGLEVPVMEAVAERLQRAEEAGHGDEDMAATYWATAGPA
ncbi:MAG TPA: NAD(P)-dependent oxidoreductase [Solirubrobacteraceae bacterium]